jgi:uroporphyrinogen-III decarboxylase
MDALFADDPDAAEILADGRGAYTRRFLEVFGEEYWCCPWVSGPFWALYHAFGFRGLMENMVLRPDLVAYGCELMNRRYLAHAEASYRCGIRKGYVFDAFCGSDLISIPQYEQIVFPAIRTLLERMLEIGYEDLVFCHLGGIDERVDLLAELPLAALAFEESKKGFVIDLAWIRERVGPDLTLYGNTDILFLRDAESEQQVQDDIRRQYEEAGPRFVVSIGSPLAEDTTAEKVWWMLNAAHGLR